VSGLTSGELARMRTDLNLSLPGTAVIHRRTETSDSQGGVTAAYAAVGTVDCRLSPSLANFGSGEELHGDRVQTVTTRMLTVPGTTDINSKDRVVVDSVTYSVTEVRGRSYEVSRRCVVVEAD
jgi:head-tail adaptor